MPMLLLHNTLPNNNRIEGCGIMAHDTPIGIVGLGDMGFEFAKNLNDDGYSVHGYDKDSKRTDAARSSGILMHGSLSELSENVETIIFLTMSDELLGSMGISLFDGESQQDLSLFENKLIVIGSTTTPAKISEIIDALPGTAHVVDAAIIGGVRPARERKVGFLAGGSDVDVDAARLFLSGLGQVISCGKSGSGAACKLISNVAVMLAEAGLRESLDLADYFDVDYSLVIEILKMGPVSALVSRAQDASNPRPLAKSAEDFDVLMESAPGGLLAISQAGRNRLWGAANSGQDIAFGDILTKRTRLPIFL